MLPPPCPNPPCEELDDRHWIDDCTRSTPAEKGILKANLKAKLSEKKAHDGPSRGTHSQKRKSNQGKDGTFALLKTTTRQNSCNCSVTVSDDRNSIESTGRYEEESDDSIVSTKLSESAAIKCISQMSPIQKVSLSAAFKNGTTDSAGSLSFSRTCTVRRTILHLASGNLALMDISFLVANDDLACEGLLIGRIVLQQLWVDTNSLLDNNRFAINGADCSEVKLLHLSLLAAMSAVL